MDCDITRSNPSGFKNMIIINRVTNKFALYEKKPLVGIKCLIKYMRMKRKIKSNIQSVSKEWNLRLGELTTDSYWDEYLELKKRNKQ